MPGIINPWDYLVIFPQQVISSNVGKAIINQPPVITIFIGGIKAIPSHGWFMALFDPHYVICMDVKMTVNVR
jgi:hypothetical protein